MMMRRWDPFVELRRMQGNMVRRGRGFPHPTASDSETDGWAIPLDVTQDGDNFVVHASVPGVNPSDLNVTIENDVLTIRGQTSHQAEQKEGRFLVRERHTGNFHRRLRLPDTLDVDQACTNFEHGVLTIAFPRLEARQSRQLPINVGGANQESEVQEGEIQGSEVHESET